MIAGLTAFLLMLITAVQVLFNLYATTVVTEAAYEAALFVAGHDRAHDGCDEGDQEAAEAGFWQALGSYRERGSAVLTWDCANSQTVSLRLVAVHPSILPPVMRDLTGLGHLDRTIEVRIENVR